ncbi:MAG: hypothetical protein EOP83_02360 [Verrucomicrobiaceae bacterium]|nr:MAG: hypothetical protein EOP83_02360 [Verrucomicrobiaceae bacterium]
MSQRPVLEKGILIRRAVFILVLILLTTANLFALFKGLNAPKAMEQAQIAREIARGNGFSTKMVSPAAYDMASKGFSEAVELKNFKDTYHAPLNPLINSVFLRLIGANDAANWQMREKEMVFPLDRVIAAISTLFFLMSIAVTYLLVTRIFDPKIAGVTAILMLFCQTFWDFSLSGLPQMLMLLLFTSALYFAYRAVEAQSEGRLPFVPALIAGVFFTLLALTHWMTVWIALGYVIYAAMAFRPRGVIGAAVIVLIILAAVGPMLRAYRITDSPFGAAFLTLYNGVGSGAEEAVMRSHDLTEAPAVTDGLVMKIVRTTLLQTMDIIPLLAGIVVAPLFFLALLHPFKRAPIANFRWVILLMWVTAAIGLSFYGVSSKGLDPNQLHLLFAPIMAAYGIALVSILWSRLPAVNTSLFLRNTHLYVIVLVCAMPMMIILPRQVIDGMNLRDSGGLPHWPPYYAPALNIGLKKVVKENEIVVADQPWAVAWYADRVSLWLPNSKRGFEKFETIAADSQTPLTGILISPVSNQLGSIAEIYRQYQDFTSLVIDGRTYATTSGFRTFDKDPKLESIAKRYPYPLPLFGVDMIFYSDRVVRSAPESGR